MNEINGFDPTYVNVDITRNNECPNCGSKDFDEFKEGDFREVTFVKLCKNCKHKY